MQTSEPNSAEVSEQRESDAAPSSEQRDGVFCNTAQHLMEAIHVALLGIFEYDHLTRAAHCSPAFRENFGMGADEVVTPESIVALVVPEDREQLLTAMRKSLDPDGDGLMQREQRIELPRGMRWVQIRTQTFFEPHGSSRRPARTVASFIDITERKRTELELSASRQQLRTALDAARLGVWNRDIAAKTITCDDLTRSIFGWDKDTPCTLKTLVESIIPEDRERFLRRRSELIESDDDSDSAIEYRIQLPNGQQRWVSVHRSILHDDAGTPTSMIGVVRDITRQKHDREERRALEEQFRHAQKMEAMGRLAGGIAHDFNNLLMVIRSYTEILEDALPPQDALRRNTQAIIKAAERAASLTGQMLAFSRKQVLSPIPLSLNGAIAEAARMLQRLIGEDIELRVKPDPDTWTVRADPDQIAQVLMNLSVNSRDAMPEGGILTLATHNFTVTGRFFEEHPYMPPGDYAVLSVTDTGTGIPQEVQIHMFEPFFTTKGIGKGTGLGLSTVYGIVKQSGGYLLVDSEPGHGATFSIYLPRIHDAISGAETGKTRSLHSGNETILVVEDENALRESMREFLAGLGYTVLSADSGPLALDIAGRFARPIHLLLTDVVMPRMSGRELSQILTGVRPAMKTIFMSGYTDDSIVRHGVREQGAAFLQKPFSLTALARKLRELLD